MTLYKMVDGERVEVTPAEEAEFRRAWSVADAAQPTTQWLAAMAASDTLMPRALEDVIDKIGTAKLPQATIDKYNAKKALRAQKP